MKHQKFIRTILAVLFIFVNIVLLAIHFLGLIKIKDCLGFIYLFVYGPWQKNSFLEPVIYSINLIVALSLLAGKRFPVIILRIEAVLNIVWLLTIGLFFYAFAAQGGRASQMQVAVFLGLAFFGQISFLFLLSWISGIN